MSSQIPDNQKNFSWNETVRTVLVALALALFFRSFFFEPFHIPSGSMKNTMLVGDYLFVSKYRYGYSRYSFPLGLPLFEGRAMELTEPKRGDIVVFRPPSNPRIDFIKRVIGLPGDHIQVKDGVLFINGEALKRKLIGDVADSDIPGTMKTVQEFAETLPEGKVIHVLKRTSEGFANNTPMYTVPERHYFMMGDNRDNSHDSRFLDDVGYVSEENIVGRAEIIFYSNDGTAHLSDPASWVRSMRFDRFFSLIE